MTQPNSEHLTTQQLAEKLGVSSYTIFRWRKAKTGPPFRRLSGRTIRYVRADVNEWLKARDAA